MKRSETHMVASVTRRHSAEIAAIALAMLRASNSRTDDDRTWMVATPYARAFLDAIRSVRHLTNNSNNSP